VQLSNKTYLVQKMQSHWGALKEPLLGLDESWRLQSAMKAFRRVHKLYLEK
jgi:hypothetical protein